ncbi:MAG: hypothetical protein K2P95_04190 [Hyphomonadaceae bacterium]|nr:hypothetical protein [Hyphomonadaceae bacterium]
MSFFLELAISPMETHRDLRQDAVAFPEGDNPGEKFVHEFRSRFIALTLPYFRRGPIVGGKRVLRAGVAILPFLVG